MEALFTVIYIVEMANSASNEKKEISSAKSKAGQLSLQEKRQNDCSNVPQEYGIFLHPSTISSLTSLSMFSILKRIL